MACEEGDIKGMSLHKLHLFETASMLQHVGLSRAGEDDTVAGIQGSDGIVESRE
jgi:hypothetical protein